jgi:hypothetical protein
MSKQSLEEFEEGITLEDIREVLIEAGEVNHA